MWPFNKQVGEKEKIDSLRFKIVKTADEKYKVVLLTNYIIKEGQLVLHSSKDCCRALCEHKGGKVTIAYPTISAVTRFDTEDKAFAIAKAYTKIVGDSRDRELVVEEKIIEFKV